MSILDILSLIMPAFALIGIGYGTGVLRLFGDTVGEALASFVFTLGLPLLLMRSVATAPVPDASPWPFWLTYFVGVVVAWTVAQQVIRRLYGEPAGVALIGGLTASFSNLVLLGIPIVFTTYGEDGMVPLLLLVSIHFPVMVTVATILFERMQVGRSPAERRLPALLRRILVSLVKNPLIIGIAAGFALRATGITLVGLPKTVVDQLADASSPLSLFALGLGLKRYGLRGNLAAGLTTAVVKLLLMPAVVFFVARLVGLPPLWVAVTTTMAACPTGANVFMFSARFGVGHGLSSTGITLSTLLAVATMTGWIAYVAAAL